MTCTRQPGTTQWCTEAADAHRRIAELEHALWLLAGDVEALHRSHAHEPPITREEIYHLARAQALLSGYEPPTE